MIADLPCRDVVVFMSHRPELHARRLRKIVDGAVRSRTTTYAVVVLGHGSGSETVRRRLDAGGQAIQQILYAGDLAEELGYPGKASRKPFTLKPGNADLILIKFMQTHPTCERLWVFEDDVEYSGSYVDFIDEIAGLDADLVATHLARCPSDWTYRHHFRHAEGDSRAQDEHTVFLPFHVVRRKALMAIHDFYLRGGAGHHEMVWATVLKGIGMSIVDIGGRGEFVSPGMVDRHYLGVSGDGYRKLGSFGTLTIRLRPGAVPGKLWHPVKPLRQWLPQMGKRLLSYLRWQLGRLG